MSVESLNFLAVIYIFSVNFFSFTRHQMVKVAKVAKLIHIYLTR